MIGKQNLSRNAYMCLFELRLRFSIKFVGCNPLLLAASLCLEPDMFEFLMSKGVSATENDYRRYAKTPLRNISSS